MAASKTARSNAHHDDDGRLALTASQRRHCRHSSSTPAVVVATWVVCVLTLCGPAAASTCDTEVGTGDDDEWRPPSAVEMVLRAQTVIYGRVRRTIPDPAFDFGFGTQVYTAEMEVFCTLKGRRLERFVNLTRAGYIPGSCYSTSLSPDTDYIVIAEVQETRVPGGTTRLLVLPVDTEIVATSSNINEVASACRLRPKYPHGVSEWNAEVRCPNTAPPGECLSEQDFTTTTTTTPSTTSLYDYNDDYYYYYTENDINEYVHQPFVTDPPFTDAGESAASLHKTSPDAVPRSKASSFVTNHWFSLLTALSCLAHLLQMRSRSL